MRQNLLRHQRKKLATVRSAIQIDWICLVVCENTEKISQKYSELKGCVFVGSHKFRLILGIAEACAYWLIYEQHMSKSAPGVLVSYKLGLK